MMQQLRKSTKWIMILVAIAFGGLMFFEWGMDITGQSTGSTGQIGRVNGTPVMYDDYFRTYQNLYEQTAATQEEPVTTTQNSQLEDQAWEEMVTSILIQQELDRRGIVVTDEEIRSAARFSPPPGLMQNPELQTDGQFDLAKYQQLLSVLSTQELQGLEDYYRTVIPRAKLLRQVGSGIYVSDNDLWNTYRAQNEKASVRFVAFDPLARISEDRFEITDDEVADYYDENREDFFVPASAHVIAVAISKRLTAADTAAVVARAEELRQEILDGADFGEVAQAESSDETTAPEGGDLGVFPRDFMVPAFDTAVFAARLNRVTEPVRTDFGIHLVEVTQRWGQDSAQARHILLPIERSEDSEIALFTAADSLEELGESMSLVDAAMELGLETDTVEFLETALLVPVAGDVADGGEWAFDPETSPGDVSPVYENRVSFYALELLSVDPSHYLTQEEAEPAIRAAIAIVKKIEVAMDEAREAAAEVRGGRSMDEVARELGLELRDAGPFTRTEFVFGLGQYNPAVGTAFGLAIGEVSDAVQANQNAFVIERTGSETADSLAWVTQVDIQRMQLLNALREQRLVEWIDALRAEADIVDRREEVLNPPEDATNQIQVPAVF
ncbi:MAG: hypothetical protein F4123_13155 [Gemmatimonadetes bacterium]|nr:hypothetical protein [Gemmatimonadota bacterium]MYB99386.1 hypothetical protein [Gemmatimonadota bacterium]MYI47302.1 hypothetical protein [Gemmatimonadota bacterium]